MKKRLLSVLLTLTMVLTLLPVSAFAVEQKDDYLGGVSLSVGTPKNHLHADPLDVGTFTATVGNTDSYQRLPRLTSYCPRCYDIVLEAIPEYYMVPQVGSYSLSKEGVIDNCSFSLAYSKSMSGYPCLQFNYDAVGAGITEVDLTVYYNFNDPGIAGRKYRFLSAASATYQLLPQMLRHSSGGNSRVLYGPSSRKLFFEQGGCN